MTKKSNSEYLRFNNRMLNRIVSCGESKSFKIYENKQNGIRIFYPWEGDVSNEVRSMRVFKRKLYHYAYKWKRFLTLTYDNENLERVLKDGMKYGKDFSLFLNKLRNHTNRYIAWWQKGKSAEFKKKYLLPFGYKHRISGKLSYAMKYEVDSSWSRQFNPHFHVLLSNGYDWKYLRDVWKNGHILIANCGSKMKAIGYITKYMSKESEYTIPMNTRRYSSSMDIKRVKSKFSSVFDYGIKKSELLNKVYDHNISLNHIDKWV